MKLTSTRRALLSAALQRDDGTLELPSILKGGAARKVIGKLLSNGLVEEIPASGSMPVWRKDDERRVALRITAAGLAAIQAGDAAAGNPTKENPARHDAATTRRAALGHSRSPSPQSPAASLRVTNLQNRTG